MMAEESGDGSGRQGLSVIFRTALITQTKRENGGSRIMLHLRSGEEPAALHANVTVHQMGK